MAAGQRFLAASAASPAAGSGAAGSAVQGLGGALAVGGLSVAALRGAAAASRRKARGGAEGRWGDGIVATYVGAEQQVCRLLGKPTRKMSFVRHTYVAVGQNQWYHFGVGAPPILVYFRSF